MLLPLSAASSQHMHSAIILGIELILGIDIFGALETDASFLLFFPSQYQADNA